MLVPQQYLEDMETLPQTATEIDLVIHFHVLVREALLTLSLMMVVLKVTLDG